MTDFANWRLSSGLWPASTVTFSNHTVDANNDGIAFEIQARDTNPITHIEFRYGARTGTPPTFVATLEGKSATTGFPDGTDVGGGSPTAKTFTPPADATWDGTQQAVALTNAYTPTRGQILMATIRYSSGTIDASNLSTFTTHSGTLNVSGSAWRFPVGYRLTAGTWAGQAAQGLGAFRTASSRYGMIFENVYNTRSASTVGHRQAAKFTLPAAIANTKTIKGARILASIAGATGKNPLLKLWSASAALQDFTLDSDWASNNSYGVYEVLFDEATLSALTWGTPYYLGLEVADAVNGGVILNGLQLDDAADLSAYAGGSNAHFATYNGSAWSDDTTVYPFFELILDDITGNSGSSGGIVIGG